MSRANAWSNMKANLAEPVYDPHEGLYLAPDFQARLARQLEQVRAGERGVPLADLDTRRDRPKSPRGPDH